MMAPCKSIRLDQTIQWSILWATIHTVWVQADPINPVTECDHTTYLVASYKQTAWVSGDPLQPGILMVSPLTSSQFCWGNAVYTCQIHYTYNAFVQMISDLEALCFNNQAMKLSESGLWSDWCCTICTGYNRTTLLMSVWHKDNKLR